MKFYKKLCSMQFELYNSFRFHLENQPSTRIELFRMCGIWAVFGSDEEIQKQVLSAFRITHRGPDQFRMQNCNHYRTCAFGFHRLAIMEDMEGMQPYKTHHYPHLTLCYNGEIYNYKLLAKQFGHELETELDGEIILHMFEQGGAEFAASHLDGVFAFVVLDEKNKTVSVARDTYGVRPCFKLNSDSGFLGICSEAKGLLDLYHGDEDDVLIEPHKPGTLSVYDLHDNGKAFLREDVIFHVPGTPQKYTTRYPELDGKVEDNIRTLLTESVNKRIMGVRRIGCLLSGGLDSSLIAGLVNKLFKEKNLPYSLQTFAIGMEGSPDLAAARKVAAHLETDHHEVIFTPEEGLEALTDVIKHNESYDVTTTRASVGMFLLSKYISNKTDNIIIFSGEGADELAQGYIYFHKAPTPEAADAESRRLLSDLYLYDNLRADRTTSAWGLELRVPFLDHQFTSYFLSQPMQRRQPQNGIEKHLLRSSFANTGLIPDEVLWRPKEAFSDGVSSQKRSWFAILQEFISEQVSDHDMERAPEIYPFNTPYNKEMFYYRKLFEGFYPARSNLIPYIWMPKWIEATDPSARCLNHYKDSELDVSKEDKLSRHI